METKSRASAHIAALCMALALSACGSKVSEANYDKITNGMTEDQVGKILGIASESRNSSVQVEGKTYTSTQSKWRSDMGTIFVHFENGEMRSKHYYPPGAEPAPERR
jgi:hypothetical protein